MKSIVIVPIFLSLMEIKMRNIVKCAILLSLYKKRIQIMGNFLENETFWCSEESCRDNGTFISLKKDIPALYETSDNPLLISNNLFITVL